MGDQPSASSTCHKCGHPLNPSVNDGMCGSCMMLDALATEAIAEENNLLQESFSLPDQKEMIGHFEILDQIAHGGMGIVYKALDTKLNRQVALKTLLLGGRASEEMIQRFKREAESAASLKHPHIVGIHEVGEFEGQPYISMDLISGQNLSAKLSEQSLPQNKAARFVCDIAQAVQHAHDHKILHRDLKPSNILVDLNEHVYVTDFGLAKQLDKESSMTLTGQVLGSPNYLPPEQAAGQHQLVNRSSDIYSLGAILYQCLTGRAPFMAESVQETLIQIRDQNPPSPRVLNTDISVDLETICLKCLQKQPEKRYTTAQELAEDLERYLTGTPILARPVSQLEKTFRWCQRHPTVATLSAALMISICLGFGTTVWQLNRVQEQSRLNQEQVVKLSVMNGVHLMNEGDYFQSLLWFVDALQNEPETSDRREVHRKRIASVLSQCPELKTIVSHNGQPIGYADFSPIDDRLVTVGGDLRIRMQDVGTGELLWQSEPFQDPPYIVRFSPDAKHVVAGFFDLKGSCQIFDARDGSPVSPRLSHHYTSWNETWTRPTFSPDGSLLAIRLDHKNLGLWNVAQSKFQGDSIRIEDSLKAFQFTHDSMSLLTEYNNPKRYESWNTQTGQIQPLPFNLSEFEQQLVLSQKLPYALGQNSLIDLRNPSNDPHVIPFSSQPTTKMLHPDGERLISGHADRTIHIIDLATDKEYRQPITLKHTPQSLSGSPDGTMLLVALNRKGVQLIDIDSGKPITPPLLHDDLKMKASFSGSGRYFLTFHPSHLLYIWDLGKPTQSFVKSKPLHIWNRNTDAVKDYIVGSDSVGLLHIQNTRDETSATIRHTTQNSEPFQTWIDQSGKHVIQETAGVMLQIFDSTTATPITPRFETTYSAQSEEYRNIQWPELLWDDRILEASLNTLSGIQLDEQNAWMHLTAEEILEGWKQMTAKRLLREDPSNEAWHFAQATKFSNVRDFEPAVFHVKKLLVQDPENTRYQSLYNQLIQHQSHAKSNASDYASRRNVVPTRAWNEFATMIDFSDQFQDPIPLDYSTHRTNPIFQTIESDGIQFDLRGSVRLAGEIARSKWDLTGLKSLTIPIKRKAQSVHFLHSAGDTYAVLAGDAIAELIIRYASTPPIKREIRSQREIGSYWTMNNKYPTQCKIAWLGTDQFSNPQKRSLLLYHYSWENPHPDQTIESIQINLVDGPCSYSLRAISLSPPTEPFERQQASFKKN